MDGRVMINRIATYLLCCASLMMLGCFPQPYTGSMADINTAAIDAYIKESRVGNAGAHNYGISRAPSGAANRSSPRKAQPQTKEKTIPDRHDEDRIAGYQKNVDALLN